MIVQQISATPMWAVRSCNGEGGGAFAGESVRGRISGAFHCAAGDGKTEEAALEDTILEFFKMTARKKEWEEEDFRYAEPYDF